MLKKILMGGLLLLALSVPILQSPPVHASINSCSAAVSPNEVSPGSFTQIHFTVNNTDVNTIRWVEIASPSANYAVASAGADNWGQTSNNDSLVIFTGGSIQSSQSDVFKVNVNSINSQQAAENWTVRVSDDSSGTNPFACSGNLTTSIVGQPIDSTPPNIYNISVTNLSNTSVRVTWLTDEASTSLVNYGLDDSYGSSSNLNNNLQSDHSVTLTGLSSNTGYHYQVISNDSSDNTAASGDNTFLTITPSSQASNAGTASNIAVSLVITNPGDKTPPTIALNTKLPNVVRSIPTVSGLATDDSAVVRLEYSTDGGQNWLPVDSAPALGSKNVPFSFTPQSLDDGNYQILARAIDGGGNITATSPLKVVVDRLPPIVGGQVVSLGPQVLVPDSQGNLSTIAGVDEQITLSAVGGATSINLVAKPTDSKLKSSIFALTQSPDTGLWSGILSFSQASSYTLTANAVDGAGNQTSRALSTVRVLPAGKITASGTNRPIQNTQLTVYYLEPESNDWVIWDGSAYGQANPQTTDKNGDFSLVLPAGKYYLKAAAKGYRRLQTDSFSLNSPTAVSSGLQMSKRGFFIPWLDFSTQKLKLSANITASAAKSPLLGQTAPDFNLRTTEGGSLKTTDLLGKPSDLIFMNTWAPNASQQLSALSGFKQDQDVNIEPVAVQENAARVNAYDAISGYSLRWLTDPDSTTTNSFSPNNLPTHYLIDRNGAVKKIISGILTKDEILSELSGL